MNKLLHHQTQAIQQLQKDIDYLFATLPLPHYLKQASHYAMTGNGKNVRPLLVASSFTTLIHNNVNTNQKNDLDTLPLLVRRAMLAVELIHTYSLVHDDLPCMDDDDLRRGRATCHIAFDEATALLVGDVLQSLAFEVLTTDILSDPNTTITDDNQSSSLMLSAQLVAILAPCSRRMVAGQMLDIEGEQQDLSYEQLKAIHVDKTGALIEASILMGARCAGATEQQLAMFTQVAKNLGLAFQVQDDILDVTADTEQLGKPSGSDEKLDKSTYVKLMGVEQANDYANNLFQQAKEYLEQCGADNHLMQLADWLWQRKK